MDLALGMLVGATIAIISFMLGYHQSDKRYNIEVEEVVPTPTPIIKPDTSDIFRIKNGPKKGLLTYRKNY